MNATSCELKSRSLLIGLAAAVALLSMLTRPTHVRADGMIIIDHPHIIRPPHPMPPRVVYMPLSIKYHRVKVDITNSVAVTGIDQVFSNPNPRQLEGTYIFPLPDDVAVQKFSMFMEGREVKGELLDKDKARQIYEDYVRKMKDPALLEYVGSRMFKARVFPIPANGEVRITLEYTQNVPIRSGQAAYRYPLNTEKFSTQPLNDVSVIATIISDVPIGNVFCPSHKARIDRKGPGHVVLSYEDKQVTPNEDFLIYYGLSKTDFGLSLLTHRTSGEDGYFMTRLAPVLAESGKTLPKDIAFVIDVSGSMAGEKMEQARKALKFCLSNLNAQDRFNVIPFSTESKPFYPQLVDVSPDKISRAREEVDKLAAIGGTSINEAILDALKMSTGNGERPYMIVFMTDGEPTIGVTDVTQILKNVSEANKQKVRIFVLGVGTKVNTQLLDRMAEENHGTHDYVTEKEDLEIKLSNFYSALSSPVLSDLELTFEGISTHDVYPKKLSDLFKGSELVVFGRYDGSGEVKVSLAGRREKEKVTFIYSKEFPRETTANDFVPRLWAMAKIGYLMDQIRLHGSNQELKDEIVRLSKKHGVMTEMTSYLVLEDEKVRPAAAPTAMHETLNRMRGRSESWGYGGTPGSSTGAKAVDVSRNIQQHQRAGGAGVEYLRQQVDSIRDKEGQMVLQNVGARTFYRQGRQWVDSLQVARGDKPLPTTQVKLYSNEYFDLVRKYPEAARYFALGPEVVLVLGDRAYQTIE